MHGPLENDVETAEGNEVCETAQRKRLQKRSVSIEHGQENEESSRFNKWKIMMKLCSFSNMWYTYKAIESSVSKKKNSIQSMYATYQLPRTNSTKVMEVK